MFREETLCTAVDSLDRFYAQQPDIPALLTLGHLAQRAQVPYWRLRSVVERFFRMLPALHHSQTVRWTPQHQRTST